jgi:hypothetical protein
MRNIPRCILSCVGFLTVFTCSLSAQQATVNRKVNLRRDPSTSSPILGVLAKGSRLDLVEETAHSGFYHVRTEDDEVGWVSTKYVTVSSTPAIPPMAAPCDSTLWNHVYHPSRLIVKQPCIEVTGTIVDATSGSEPDGVRHEPDGDTHGWLKVDPQFANLLNAGNKNDEGGNLVFEIVCRFPVTQTDAKAACANYTDHGALPSVGSHVRMVGTLVQDTFHGQWMEIHPVTSITVIP